MFINLFCLDYFCIQILQYISQYDINLAAMTRRNLAQAYFSALLSVYVFIYSLCVCYKYT